MFVRVKKIGAYEYLYLVENAREGGRHVQRVIKALGRRDEVEASGLIDGHRLGGAPFAPLDRAVAFSIAATCRNCIASALDPI